MAKDPPPPPSRPRRFPYEATPPVPDPTATPAASGPPPQPCELAAVVDAARSGDAEAFHELVRRFERLVFKIAWHKCRDQADAEDLAQEIFLHAFRSLPFLRDARAFTGWLISLSHNRANRYCRRRQRNIVVLEEARRALAERASASA
ncbi:MAG: hypothetical protein L0Z55_06665, partial [Planctomycetes bacterium]|nr:hypothetical protein [Planctomycetota bacterium]